MFFFLFLDSCKQMRDNLNFDSGILGRYKKFAIAADSVGCSKVGKYAEKKLSLFFLCFLFFFGLD